MGIKRNRVHAAVRVGVIQLRQLMLIADSRAESPRESWTRLEIVDAGLPALEPQYWIRISGVPRYRLDLAYPKCRVAVEYDGVEFHRTEEQRRHDARRREWLRRQGWTVVVRNGDFTGTGRDRWIGELRAALRSTYSNRRW